MPSGQLQGQRRCQGQRHLRADPAGRRQSARTIGRVRMTRLQKIASGIAILAGIAAPLASGEAHHSFAMFDPANPKTITGTVKEFEWTNPHVVLWVYSAAKEGETPELWNVELTSP